MKTITIHNKKIGKEYEPFIIAEAGINHNGDIELAKKMIVAAKNAGADAVKFQTFYAEEFIQDRTTMYTYKSKGKEITEPMIDMFRRTEFTYDEWKEIKEYCDLQEILFLSTPGNVHDLEFLCSLGIEAIKVGSDDFVNIPLIRRYAKEPIPILLSCGMATEEEIDRTLKVAGADKGKEIFLFLCTSQYPTPYEDVNISKLLSITEKYPEVVPGFSDHTQGAVAATMAIAYGARIFEKHFTLSHDLAGPDHWFSEEPDGLKNWITAIRTAYKMLGSRELKPTDTEVQMRELCHRSITASVDIKKGGILMENHICLRRPGVGLPASLWDEVIGKTVLRDVKKGCQLSKEDIWCD